MRTRVAQGHSAGWGALLLVALACSPALSQEGSSPQTTGGQLADVHAWLRAGNYDDAERNAQYVISSLVPGQSNSTAADVEALNAWVESLWRNGRSTPATLAAAERAVARARILPDGTPQLVESLRNLGQVTFLAGRYEGARGIFEQALTVAQRSGGALEATRVANCLDDLAMAFIEVNRYADAERVLDRSLKFRESASDTDNLAIARTLELRALQLLRQARYTEAHSPLEHALATREHLQPGHPDLARTRLVAGDLAVMEGRFQEARDLYAQSLDIAETRLRADHPDVALYASALAVAWRRLGDYPEALRLRERAVGIARRTFGEQHPIYAGYLNDLAISHVLNEDYANARPLFERSLAIHERAIGRSHQRIATIVYNLGIVSRLLGDTEASRRHLRQATDIWRHWLGKAHPIVANALFELALVSVDEGNDVVAVNLLNQSLLIRERALGSTHIQVAQSLTELASVYARLGRIADADSASTRAVRIWETANTPRSVPFAEALERRGRVLTSNGNYEESRAFFDRALAIYQDVFGASHPFTTSAHAASAEAMLASGDARLAFSTALDAERNSREQLRLTLRYLPERDAVGYAGRRLRALDTALAALGEAGADADLERAAFDALVRSRALVLDEMAARQRISTDAARAELRTLWQEVASRRQRLATLIVRGRDEDRPGQYRTLLESARRDKDVVERALAEKSSSFANELADREIGLDDVADTLTPGSAVVSILRYEKPRSRSSAQAEAHYAAFVLGGDRSIAFVPLGREEVVDAAVSQWRREASLPAVTSRSRAQVEESYRAAGERVRRLLWDPLLPALSNADRVFMVPDGPVSLVNFAALPASADGYLIDHGPTIHYASAERDLVSSLRTDSSGRGLLALGGASFNAAAGTVPSSAVAFRGAIANCRSFQSLRFAPLPATRGEASEIAGLWAETTQAAQLLEGDGASEAAFKQLAPGRRVLHVATHGFFLGSECPGPRMRTRAVGGLVSGSPVVVNADNPLLLAGLALAGANRRTRSENGEDGILTAEEVGALDLSGVEWAVLSACDTGLGEIRAGEGVFGLRRAFQVAGVRTVIMSLWSVDDQATRLWMRALYEGRLQRSLTTAEAVREASLTVLRDRRARSESTHPFYWGAFVAAGDWR
jgi:CHAT domain-containing protein